MPKKEDIVIAVKNSKIFLKVPELEGATVKLKSNGQPYFHTGGFTMVFHLTKNSKKWAFRVWHIGINEQENRFKSISKYLEIQKLPYFVDFIYDEKGLLVNGKLVDTTRMQWLYYDLLKNYIEKNLYNKQKLQELASNFVVMCEKLHKYKISHGDLQHGNIMIDNQGNIKLIDYDSVCVPDIEGQEEYVTGLRGYQHPSRINSINNASLKADYFSELIIYLSLCGLSENPQLWDMFNVKDTEVLLFSEEDFENLQQSEIYKELTSIKSHIIDDLLEICVDYLNTPSYLLLKPFYSYLIPPEIIQFSAEKSAVISGQKVTLFWKVKNAHKVEIDNGIGDVNIKGSISIFPVQNTIYKLTASGHGGDISEEVHIIIFPTPIIKSLLVPMPQIEQNINIHIHTPTPTIPQIDTMNVSLKAPFQLSMENVELSVKAPEFVESNFHIPGNFKFLNKIEENFQNIKKIINNRVS